MCAAVRRRKQCLSDAILSSVDSASPGASRGGSAQVGNLAALLLAYVVGMAALATLWPFDFRMRVPRLSFYSSPEDLVLNLGLLFPAGFLWRLVRPRPLVGGNLDVLVLGVGLSSVLEGLQMFLPRTASPTDVVMNGLGAWAGATVYSRLERGWVDRICLALPLTKVLYLTVPLLALQAWAAKGRYAAVTTLVPLAAFSASIAAELYRNAWRRKVFGVGHTYPPLGAAAVVVPPLAALRFVVGFVALFGLGATPLWARLPQQALWLVPVAAAFAWISLRFPPRVNGERRMEQIALRRALPWLGAFLFLIALPRFAGHLDALHGSTAGFYVLRDAATFSVLGYVLSQLHARGKFGSHAELRAAFGAFAAIALFGALRSWQLMSELPELGVLVAAGVLGAAIHRAELTAIRALRGRASDRPSNQPPVPASVQSV